jgi:hypothetical protein
MSSRQVRWLLVVGVLILLGSAESAWAWGPATHVYLANQLLAQAGLLSAGLAALLVKHSRHFLYGNIAADVVLGKRLSKVKHSCHKWSVPRALLKAARSGEQEAFAYGYLAHLAADVVAHNKFLPRQLLLSKTTMGFGHLFWEIRGDSCAGGRCWDQLHAVLTESFPQHERSLERQLADTLLPFETNLKIFNRMYLLTCARRWRKMMDGWAQRSRWELDQPLLMAYQAESLELMQLALERMDDPWLLEQEPSGAATLEKIRGDRRLLRRLSWQGLGSWWLAGDMAQAYAPAASPFRRTSVA